MKRLYRARDTLEANLLKDRLATSHIEARVFGEFIGGAIGELPAIHFPEVWVDNEDLVPAERVLKEFLHPAEDAGRWVCPGCGETVEGQFDLCWKCGTGRP
jgi:hypothetical protein